MRVNEEGLGRLIKNGAEKNVFFIFGEDDYLKSFYCGRLVDTCVPEEAQTFNLHIYSDNEVPFDDIFATAESYPMMADRMLLLVRNYDLAALKKEKLDDFVGRLKSIPPTTVIVFYFDTVEVEYGPAWRPAAWNAVIDAIDGFGVVAELNKRGADSLAGLLVKRAPGRGATIGRAEAEYLVECVGTDMQNLLNEFNKVCAYAQGSPVTREMIDEVCVKSVSADVFLICDSLLSRDNDTAFAVLGELFHMGASAHEILGAMSSTFVNMYRIKSALNSGHTFDDVARAFAMNKGQISAARRLVNVVKPMRISVARQCLRLLSDADVKIKRSNADDSVVLTELIAMLGETLKNA